MLAMYHEQGLCLIFSISVRAQEKEKAGVCFLDTFAGGSMYFQTHFGFLAEPCH